MRLSITAILLTTALTVPASAGAEETPRNPVVVELFTSEGCSSCPPADRLLSKIEKEGGGGHGLITLSEHIDYWNYLGWKDPFSKRVFSKRQNEYCRKLANRGPYTPQMVVDGRYEFVGSDSKSALKSIERAEKFAKIPLSLAVSAAAPSKLKIKIKFGPDRTEQSARQARLLVFVTEDNLSVKVNRGENSGRQLIHNSVVRKLVDLGIVGTVRSGSAETELAWNKRWRKQYCKIIGLLQEPQSGAIVGAAELKLD